MGWVAIWIGDVRRARVGGCARGGRDGEVTATSIERYVSPVEAHDAPIVSAVLGSMLARRGHFGDTLHVQVGVVRERATVSR